ncbi:transcription elongation factor Elf1, putative [Bodo saltans]|uniref:Transcription elongation factor 1 homolog n=1 Tax=Bodo saltans TaxID=75058 RepID=A0A0S4JF06_BODSA|nr:transcription elongation factor Elf1, putative [Bodo saltans]|eukprot:CUG90068.1 transcription elongation factor Elf1, putative [Bodo saltans]
MGGKKASAKAPLKKQSKYKIPAMFGCPLCDAKSCVVIRIVRSAKEASVRCRVCGATENGIRCSQLEKSCDVYFKFRDKVQNADRAYLRKSGIQTSAANAGVNSLQMVLGVEGADEDHLMMLAGNMGRSSQHPAAVSRRRPREDDYDDDDDDGGHHFAAASDED